MKNIRFLMFVLTIGTLLLSACGGAAAATTPTSVASGKVEAMPVAFIGTVDSMAGDQWVISGTTVTVAPAVVRDGPFNVGDQVKVEGVVNPDGSFTVSRVEVPAPQDVAGLPQFGDDNSNAKVNDDNGNDVNVNDDHGNDANINDDHGNDANINDDHGNDANTNDDHGNDANLNDANTNDDNGGAVSPSNNNTNDNHGGSGKGGGGGNDNGGGGGGGNDDGGGHG